MQASIFGKEENTAIFKSYAIKVAKVAFSAIANVRKFFISTDKTAHHHKISVAE